ncbi:MAG TPA: class I tRNA ligase family protein [Solirubrobacteraceae bacterium]|nr:class I tRNA ligase family protein [Solirubrobacteraceae bacterium]
MSEVNLDEQDRTEPIADHTPRSHERHWQQRWRETQAFATPGPQDERSPAYVLSDCALASDASLGQLRGLTIADACARFLRARGRAVLFSVGFDAFGPRAELHARSSGMQPHEWALHTRARIQRQLEALGCSCDWKRAFASSDDAHYRWTQSLFLAMLERDLIYRAEPGWLMRMSRYASGDERDLEALGGWDTAALEAQRAVLDRVEGVEIRASTFGGEELIVFTPHADAVEQAKFVAVSPAFPQVERWLSDPELSAQVAAMRATTHDRESDEPPVIVTEQLAVVPGAAGILPIVVSPIVDSRFGATAALGIPELDAVDAAIAKRLPAPTGVAWKTSSSSASAHPATRSRMRDVPISRPRAWGAPIPLVHCPACGTQPVRASELPVRLPEDLSIAREDDNPLAARADFYGAVCPSCGGSARRETDTIDPRLDRMWMWLAVCVPAEHRASTMMNDPEYARWLPAQRLIAPVDAAAGVFERRVLARIMQDIGELPPLPGGEPFSGALPYASVRVGENTISVRFGDMLDLDQLLTRVGADAVRLAMLHGASAGRALPWSEESLRFCERFLQALRDYAEPRLREWARIPGRTAIDARIDTSDKLCRRLAHWCAVACEKVTSQLERSELQRATHNVVRLLERVRDFESTVLPLRGRIVIGDGCEHGELDAREREAIVFALLLLVRLLAPLAPYIAEELWAAAGNTTLVGEAAWPGGV